MKIILSVFRYISLKLTTPLELTKRFKLILILLSLTGFILSLLSTSRYGAGLSPDSIHYISAARNIAGGFGVTSFNGSPFVYWPPLYPILLSIPDLVFNLDPLVSAPVINAILFGLIIYFSGLLLSRHLCSSIIALLGAALIVFSTIMLDIASMAWSETLFVFLSLVFLLYLGRFLVKTNWTSFIIFTLAVSLASLTRYIGVCLIPTGVIVMFFFLSKNSKIKFKFIFLFVAITVIPIGIVVLRNYNISGTPFGGRNPSITSFSENLGLIFNILLSWGFFPPRGSAARLGILVVIIGMVIFGVFYGKGILPKLKTALINAVPIAFYIVLYFSFLLYSSTSYAFEQINWRYLAPIYIPLTILFLILINVLLEPFRQRFSALLIDRVLSLTLIIWVVYYPMNRSINTIHWWMKAGTSGYSQVGWRESDIIRYLNQNPLDTGHLIFTNDPLALYILANMKCQKNIVRINSTPMESAKQTEKSDSSFVNEKFDYFIWFNNVNKQDYPYSKDEMEKSTNVKNLVQLKDGTIFLVKRIQK